MIQNLHAIELEKNGEVFARFRNEAEYDEYLGDLAVDYHDGDFNAPENYKVWFCVFVGGDIASMTESEYKQARKLGAYM